MNRKMLMAIVAVIFLLSAAGFATAGEVEILGVKFPTEKQIEGKTLKLNGVAYRKALGFVKVFVVGLYLEKTTTDPNEVITSEQVKHMHTHYLSSKVTAKKLSSGFIKEIEKCNPKELVDANRTDVDKYASWLNKDMAPGLTSKTTYVPGKGLTLEYQDEVRGTIAGNTFARMYYQYNVGEKANSKIKKGLLGAK